MLPQVNDAALRVVCKLWSEEKEQVHCIRESHGLADPFAQIILMHLCETQAIAWRLVGAYISRF